MNLPCFVAVCTTGRVVWIAAQGLAPGEVERDESFRPLASVLLLEEVVF